MALTFRPPSLGRAAARFPAFAPEEEQEAIDSLIGKLGSTLVYAGETLDKPGAAVRGLLAGRPDQLLNLIPFSDAMGLTDPSERTYGRDLLEQYGMLDPNRPGLDVGDVAGFGVDVITDPLSWITPLALGKGARVLQKTIGLDEVARLAGTAGKREGLTKLTFGEVAKLPEFAEHLPAFEKAAKSMGTSVAELGPQKLGYGTGVGIPFKQPSFVLGGGRGTAKFMDVAAKEVADSALGRAATSLFEHAAGGEFNKYGQALSRMSVKQRYALESKATKFHHETLRDYKVIRDTFLETYGQKYPHGNDASEMFENFYLMSAEKNPDIAMAEVLQESSTPAAFGKVAELTKRSQDMFKVYHQDLVEMGVPIGTVEGAIKYYPRAIVRPVDEIQQKYHRELLRSWQNMKGRREPLANVPFWVVRRIFDDPKSADDWQHIFNQEGKFLDAGYKVDVSDAQEFVVHLQTVQDAVSNTMHADLIDDISRKVSEAKDADWIVGGKELHADAIQKWANTRREQFGKAGIVTRANMTNELNYHNSSARVRATFSSIHEAFRQNLGAVGGVPLKQAYKDLGLDPDKAVAYMAKLRGNVEDLNQPWKITREEFRKSGGNTNEYIKSNTGASNADELLRWYQTKYPALKGVRIGGLSSTTESGQLINEGTVSISRQGGKFDPNQTMIHLTADADLTVARHEIEHLLDEIHGVNLEGKQAFGRYEHEHFNKSDYLHRSLVRDAVREGKSVPPEVLKDYPGMAARQGKAPHEAGKAAIDDLARQRVPLELVEATKRASKRIYESKEANQAVKMYDKVNQWWKSRVTLPFPAFISRNLMGGQYVNVVLSGEVDSLADAGKYIQSLQSVWEMSHGKAEQDFVDLIEAWGVLGQGKHFQGIEVGGMAEGLPTGGLSEALNLRKTWKTSREVVEGQGHPLRQAAAALPGGERLLSAAGKIPGVERGGELLGKVTKPFRTAEELTVQTGGKLNERVELFNRATMFHYLIKHKGYSAEMASRKVKKLQFDYSELTPFEKSFMRRVVPFYCVPEDSEALTRDGWKHYTELNVGDDMLTYNIDVDCYEWQPCLEVASFWHDQEVTTWKNKRHTIRSTDDHRWAIRRQKMQDTNLDGRIRTYPEKTQFVTTKDLNTSMAIIVTSEFKSNEESLLTPTQARLLGWIVTDGSFRKRKPTHTTQAVIYQTPRKFLQEVQAVAGGHSSKPHPETGTIQVHVLRDRVKEIEPYLSRDNLMKVVTRLSRGAMDAMYDAMYKADGTTVEHRKQDYFAAQHPGVRGAFRVLATMLGKRVSESANGCCVSSNRFLKIAHGNFEREHYEGVVWCPRTENGTWVMRQGNLITITGNTFSRKMAGLTASTLAEHPGGGLAQTIRATTEASQGEEWRPGEVAEHAAIPLGPEGQFLTGFGLPHEDVFDVASVTPTLGGTLRRTGEKIVGRSSPLISTAYTLLTGTEPFYGRAATSLDPKLGRALSTLTGSETVEPLLGSGTLETVAGKLAWPRHVSTFVKAADERKSLVDKAVNLLTGARVTDVHGGIEAAQDRELRTGLNDVLTSLGPVVRSFPLFFVQPEKMSTLTPENRALVIKAMRLGATIKRRQLSRRSQERSPRETFVPIR